MYKRIEKINDMQNRPLHSLPHCSNLMTQLVKCTKGKIPASLAKREPLSWFNNLIDSYLETRILTDRVDNDFICKLVDKTNSYMKLLIPPATNPFSHQADFSSSIIPEMLCNLFSNIIHEKDLDYVVSAQKDLIIEYAFTLQNNEPIMCVKKKRMDVSVVKECEISFNNVMQEMPIPILAIECKTNLDKNMLSGIERSVADLKKSFPECRYYVATENSDADPKKINCASSAIDEIYIFRKQKRSVVRHTPASSNDIQTDLVIELADSFRKTLDEIGRVNLPIDERMSLGKLIGERYVH